MSTPVGSSQWMYATDAGFYDYSIDQSLRFNDGDAPNLTQTYGGSGTSTALGTFSWWMKIGNVPSKSQENIYFESGGYGGIQLRSGKLAVNSFDSNNTQVIVQTDALLRDSSSWYHCVVSVNGTAGTIKFYINGVEQAQTVSVGSLVAGRSWDMLGYDSRTNFTISKSNSSNSFDGYLAEFNYIDGSALDATSFGETINGVWVPKQYTGSHGTNGFYLPFDDSSAIGDDESGNTNDWTANNLAASDVVPDSPTNNFTTFNPIDAYNAGSQLSNGNLTYTGASANDGHGATQTFDIANDKFYWEVHIAATNSWIGIISEDFSSAQKSGNVYSGSGMYAINPANGNKSQNPYSADASYTTAASAGDVIGFACGDGKITIYYNGTSKGDMYTSLTGRYKPFIMSATSAVSTFNFGQDHTFNGNKTSGSDSASDANGIGLFYDTPPSDFLALCTSNLPEPTIGPNSDKQADDYFDTILYTAATSNGTYTHGNLSFKPDFSWIKNRNNVERHLLTDVVRGNTSVTNKFLVSNATSAEGANGVSGTTFSVTDTGYEFVEASITSGELYFNGRTYVGWNWKAGGTAVSNTDGSTTSSVSAAPDAGFSIVSYTGTGANATVGHGLSSAPDLVIVKERNGTGQWSVQSTALSAANKVVHLQSTAAEATKADHFNSTFPTSTVFSVSTSGNTNGNNNTFIAYCFHSVDGYSKVGSHVGNGNADGTFVALNFRPAWVMVRGSSFASNWFIQDSKRDGINVINGKALRPNLTNVEDGTTNYNMDFLSNGFKLRTSAADSNTSGATFIYLAFAEMPFKYANAR